VTISSVPDPSIPTPDDEQGDAGFLEFAATMPETAEGFLDAGASPSDQPNASGVPVEEGGEPAAGGYAPPERKRVNVTKKVRRAMNKFKTKVADVPIMWFHTQAKRRPEWELDKDEQELLKDAVDTVFEVLDIEIEIEPLSWTLTSVWWVISYPILAFVFLFLTKKSLTMDKDKEQGESAA